MTLGTVTLTDDGTAEPPSSDDAAVAEDTSSEGPAGERKSRTMRWFAGVTILFSVGVWLYVLVLAVVFGRQPPVDRIGDPAFAEAGESRCAAALAAVDELPIATEAPTPRERGLVLVEANEIFAVMLDDLDGLTSLIPEDGDRGRADAWLADWRIFLEDRTDHADRLLAGEDSRLLVSPKEGEGRHITGWIDEFALANRMDSCVSPDDA